MSERDGLYDLVDQIRARGGALIVLAGDYPLSHPVNLGKLRLIFARDGRFIDRVAAWANEAAAALDAAELDALDEHAGATATDIVDIVRRAANHGRVILRPAAGGSAPTEQTQAHPGHGASVRGSES